MSSFDRSSHRLAGSTSETGGLIIKKRQKSDIKKSDDDGFKRPSGSLLGLDVLARRKRAERELEEEGSSARGEKRPRVDRTKDSFDDSGVRISFGRTDASRERKYRTSLLETPSHPGGVSEQALEKMHSRMKRDQNHGLYASSSSSGRQRGTSERREKEERGEEGQRGKVRDGEDSRRMRERAWEQETPRLERGRGNTTPYLSTRGMNSNKLLVHADIQR